MDTFQLTPSLADPNQQSSRLDPAARVTIGKRISDRVYLTYSRSMSSSTHNQIILLEYDQTDRFSWILSRNEDRTYALDVRVRTHLLMPARLRLGRAARGVAWAAAAWLWPASASRAGRRRPRPSPRCVVEREGRVVTDPFILSLLETTPGKPLSMRDVRETIAHLIGLDAFEDVRVVQETTGSGGVLVRYVLVPAHPIDRVDVRGGARRGRGRPAAAGRGPAGSEPARRAGRAAPPTR